MMKKIIYILLLALANTFFLNACEETESPSVLAGKACDPNSFKATCAGNNVLYCGKDNTTLFKECGDKTCAEFLTADTISTCAEDDEACQDELTKAATCVDNSRQCTKEGEVQSHCEKAIIGNSYTPKYTCEKTKDGQLFFHLTNIEQCHRGCNKDNSACAQVECTEIGETVQLCTIQDATTSYVESYLCKSCPAAGGTTVIKLTSTEKCDGGYGTCSESGECIPTEACDTQTFQSRCDGNIALTCVGNKIKHTYCYLYNSPHECTIIDDIAQCVEN